MGAPHTCPTCDRPHGCRHAAQLRERDAIIQEVMALLEDSADSAQHSTNCNAVACGQGNLCFMADLSCKVAAIRKRVEEAGL